MPTVYAYVYKSEAEKVKAEQEKKAKETAAEVKQTKAKQQKEQEQQQKEQEEVKEHISSIHSKMTAEEKAQIYALSGEEFDVDGLGYIEDTYYELLNEIESRKDQEAITLKQTVDKAVTFTSKVLERSKGNPWATEIAEYEVGGEVTGLLLNYAFDNLSHFTDKYPKSKALALTPFAAIGKPIGYAINPVIEWIDPEGDIRKSWQETDEGGRTLIEIGIAIGIFKALSKVKIPGKEKIAKLIPSAEISLLKQAEISAVKTVAKTEAAATGVVESKLPNIKENNWINWDNTKKVTVNSKEYAKIDNIIYTRHALENTYPTALGHIPGHTSLHPPIGISPTFVKMVIESPETKIYENIVDGVKRTLYQNNRIKVVMENNIVVTVSKLKQ